MAFVGEDTTNSLGGLYVMDGAGVIQEIVGLGDSLDGKAVSGLGIDSNGFEGEQIAFIATFTDGSSGIYIATIPEPSTAALVLYGAALLSFARRRRA